MKVKVPEFQPLAMFSCSHFSYKNNKKWLGRNNDPTGFFFSFLDCLFGCLLLGGNFSYQAEWYVRTKYTFPPTNWYAKFHGTKKRSGVIWLSVGWLYSRSRIELLLGLGNKWQVKFNPNSNTCASYMPNPNLTVTTFEFSWRHISQCIPWM